MGVGGSAVKDDRQAATEERPLTVVTASEVQDRLGDVMDRAFAGEDFLVTRYSNARVYIVGAKRYEQLLETERVVTVARNASLGR